MSDSITYNDFIQATTAWGGSVASAWTEGAKKYTEEAARVLQQSGQQVLTETQKFDIFATEQAKVFRDLRDTANAWADAADAAGKKGIGDIMRNYGEKAFSEANKVLSGIIDKKQWLDTLVADANIQISAANKSIAQTGGLAGKAFGPILDAAQMIAGAIEYQQTGDGTNWENAVAGVALSWGAAALTLAFIPAGVPVILAIGLAAIAAGVGSYLGGKYFQDVKNALLENSYFITVFDKTIGPLVDFFFSGAKSWAPPRDPLVLDLDGDGIEAVGINRNAPILFDHDGDGTKNATGWIKADDGIVVMDRNGNGLIDSGRELFGDNTVLTRGPKAGQTAANGFEALADLDLNGDGALNSADAAYAQLRIWQDVNQDGVSQAAELKTLAAIGIASINVTGTPSNVDLGNGNTQSFSGSFTSTNGQSGAAGVAELAGSLLLASNGFYWEFTDDSVTNRVCCARSGSFLHSSTPKYITRRVNGFKKNIERKYAWA